MSSESDPDRLTDDDLPSPGARTIVNFLLFVHLFTVGILMLFVGSNLALRDRSPLRQLLRRIPGYYLQVLGMDVDFDSGQRYNVALEYDEIKQRLDRIADHLKYIEDEPARRHAAETELTFVRDQQKQSRQHPVSRATMHLTHGGPLDVPHSIELHYQVDGEDRRVLLPDPQRNWPHQRFLRYQMLAREVGRLVAVASGPGQQQLLQDVRDVLPAAITAGIIRSNQDLSFDKLDALQVRFVCLRRITQQETDWRRETLGVQPPQDPTDPFWYHLVYQRIPQVIGGQIRFSQIERNTRDHAPAVANPAKGSAGKGAEKQSKP